MATIFQDGRHVSNTKHLSLLLLRIVIWNDTKTEIGIKIITFNFLIMDYLAIRKLKKWLPFFKMVVVF